MGGDTIPGMRLVTMKVSDVPEDWMMVLRTLCEPDLFAMSRWLYQDGSCWTTVLLDGGEPHELSPWLMRAQAIVTFCDEPYPVIGVYTHEDHRGKGYGQAAAHGALVANSKRIQDSGGIVYAAVNRYPKYPAIIKSHGYECWTWE